MQDMAALQDALAHKLIHQCGSSPLISEARSDRAKVQVSALIILQEDHAAVLGIPCGHEFIENSAGAPRLDECSCGVKAAEALQRIDEIVSLVRVLNCDADASEVRTE